MEEFEVNVVVSKKTEQMYRQAVDALGRAYEAFERASSVFMSDRSDDGSTVIQAIDLIKEARATRDRCAVALAEEIAEREYHGQPASISRTKTRADKARDAVASLKAEFKKEFEKKHGCVFSSSKLPEEWSPDSDVKLQA